MCQTAIRVISKSLQEVNNVDLLVKIKEDVALFIQTMEVRRLNPLLIIHNSFADKL